jgi:hypothetical protein
VDEQHAALADAETAQLLHDFVEPHHASLHGASP